MDLSDPGIEPGSPALRADSSPSEPPGKPILVLPDVIFFTNFWIEKEFPYIQQLS